MDALAPAVAQELHDRYGVEVRAAAPLSGGYDIWADSWRLDSDHGPLVLRAGRGVSTPTAEWLAVAERHAEQTGVSCRPPLRARDGTVAFRAAKATVTVRAFAAGAELDRDDPDQVRAAGATLALLHSCRSSALTQRPAPSPWHAGSWPGDHDPPALRDPELDAWHRAFIAGADSRLPYGLVHGDFWADNLIWADGRVAAVIDFSEARLDVLARELAWATWEFGHDDRYQLEVERARRFLGGYREVRGLWESGLADVLLGLMRVELRLNARYSLADPDDTEYNSALQRAFGQLRHQPVAPLLNT